MLSLIYHMVKNEWFPAQPWNHKSVYLMSFVLDVIFEFADIWFPFRWENVGPPDLTVEHVALEQEMSEVTSSFHPLISCAFHPTPLSVSPFPLAPFDSFHQPNLHLSSLHPCHHAPSSDVFVSTYFFFCLHNFLFSPSVPISTISASWWLQSNTSLTSCSQHHLQLSSILIFILNSKAYSTPLIKIWAGGDSSFFLTACLCVFIH